MTDEKRRKLNNERLSGVRLDLREKIEIVISQLETENIKPLVTCGFRSIAEQNKLFALGRTKAGKIVTNARGGQSLHNFGKAVDFAFIDRNGAISWDLKLFRRLGLIAKSYGLRWGGDWRKFKDFPHIEI